mgnify:FL=1
MLLALVDTPLGTKNISLIHCTSSTSTFPEVRNQANVSVAALLP